MIVLYVIYTQKTKIIWSNLGAFRAPPRVNNFVFDFRTMWNKVGNSINDKLHQAGKFQHIRLKVTTLLVESKVFVGGFPSVTEICDFNDKNLTCASINSKLKLDGMLLAPVDDEISNC